MEDIKNRVDEIKKKIERREAVALDATRWGFVRPHDVGLEEKAFLAGPGASVYKGYGGFWKIETKGDVVNIFPISELEAHEFRRSISQ